MANIEASADQIRTTFPEVYHSAAEAPYSINGYWLTKRRDGRSANWMIARYQPHNRSIVYQSCRTGDIAVACRRLALFAGNNEAGAMPLAARPSEVVYFIQAETGQIKIGIARDLGVRLKTLRTMCPVGLAVLAATNGGQPAESGYHDCFAAHRLHGEWFEPHPDILAEITRLNAEGADRGR